MFGTIRRHQKWLWLIIITLTVASFVIFFSPTSRYAGRGGGVAKANFGSLDGEPITREGYLDARSEVELYYFITHGNWPDRDPAAKQSGFDEERETYQRLFLIKKCRDFDIHSGSETVGQLAANILRSFGRDGTPVPPEAFVKNVLSPRGQTEADFARFLEHQLGILQLVATIGLSGHLVSPQEVELLYRLENEEIATEAAFFSASNFLARVTVTPEALGGYFTNQMARYRVADRRQVSYVKYKLADYLAAADQKIAKLTNFDAQVDALYRQRGTNYYKDAATPEAAKAEIRAEARRDFARSAAREVANQFADELMGLAPVSPDNLARLAAQKGLTVDLSAPFTAEDGPVELGAPLSFARTAFALTSEDPFAPVVAEDGVYIIALKKKIPSEIPSFDSLRPKVTADYQLDQALELARQAATDFYTTLTNGLAQGRTFAAVCTAAKVAPVKLPAFSLSTRSLPEVESRIGLARLQNLAFGLPAGMISGLVATSDGGLVLHVLARSPVSDQKLKTELPGFLTQMRQMRQSEAFNAWFSREAQVGLRDTPIARPATPKN